MVSRRLSGALVVVLSLWSSFACGRPNDQAGRLAEEIERRTVPPGASGLSLARSDMRPCVIRRQWTFATAWNRARYGEWLKAQLSPPFRAVREAPGELAFSRYDGGDTHSLTIETGTPQSGDSMRVRVTLCVYPD